MNVCDYSGLFPIAASFQKSARFANVAFAAAAPKGSRRPLPTGGSHRRGFRFSAIRFPGKFPNIYAVFAWPVIGLFSGYKRLLTLGSPRARLSDLGAFSQQAMEQYRAAHE